MTPRMTPRIGLFNLSSDYKDFRGTTGSDSAFFVKPLVETGYNAIFSSGFTIGMNAQFNYLIGDLTINGDDFPGKGIGVSAGINLGYAW